MKKFTQAFLFTAVMTAFSASALYAGTPENPSEPRRPVANAERSLATGESQPGCDAVGNRANNGRDFSTVNAIGAQDSTKTYKGKE